MIENQILIEQNINDYVKKYSERILKDPSFYKIDEGYKYKAVATFRKYFNLDAKDLGKMIEAALADAKNLVQSGQYFPKRMLLVYISQNEQYVREQLRLLLYGKETERYRIDHFIQEMESKFQKGKVQTYFDCRFLSFFLASLFPEKYFYVKSKHYSKFCKMVGYDLNLHGSQGEKFETMQEVALIVKGVLAENKDFLEVHKKITEEFDYKDSSLSWGTFDFIFNIAGHIGPIIEPEVRQKIDWQTKISKVKHEGLEDLLASDEIQDEVAGQPKTEILAEAEKYKPGGKDGYSLKEGTFKVRRDNAKQKERIRIIEDYACQVCGFNFEYLNSKGKKRKYVEVDHIIEKSGGGTEEAHNLWALCPNCHMKKTLGVIVIDLKNHKVSEDGKFIKIRDNHLRWEK